MNPQLIAIIGGFLLIVVTIMANAYWVEAVRWADKADAAVLRGDKADETRCVARMTSAKNVFRATALLLLITICATVLPAIWPGLLRLAVVIDLLCLISVVIFALIYISGRFVVPLR